jgi:teichuronic acid biosynthesis glycosyltransferase TuaH
VPTTNSESTEINILFFSLEKWDEVWRRNQFICSYLLDRHPNMSILWVNPPVDAANDHDVISHTLSGAKPVASRQRLWTVDLVKPLPNVVGRWLNEFCYLRKIQSALCELRFLAPIVWINDQNMAPVIRALRLSPRVYDITDDWTAAGLTARQKALVVENDRWLLENASHVVVCSRRLYELKSAAKSLHLIPNGVECRKYQPDVLASLHRPQELASLSGPIVGYTGTLHEDRLDTELICQLAARLPAINFVFVGPNCLESRADARLKKFENVKLLGQRTYSRLPEYMASFDICIVPHKVTAFTDSLDPLKLYEYFATGKPVVSTPCAGFRDFPELVQLCSDASQMAARISATLSSVEDSHLVESRLSYAERNCWERRITAIETLVKIAPELPFN